MTAPSRTVVALIALPEELKEFQKVFPVIADHSDDLRVRMEHESGNAGLRLVSVLADQMGSQSALHSAAIAIDEFSPDMVVVVGIAGGIDTDLEIGDVCVSNEVIDVLHNAKVTDIKGEVEISFAPDFYPVSAELVASFTFLRVHPSYAQIYECWEKDGAKDADAIALGDAVRQTGPDLHIGPMACGPVVASEIFTKKLKALHRKVAAIETESGGVFSRIAPTGIPAISIRGISDLADGDKAELERRTKGGARRLAMGNACRLLRVQLGNKRFTDVGLRYHESREQSEPVLFPKAKAEKSTVADLDRLIAASLREVSSEYRNRPDTFYLPIPRLNKLSYADDLANRHQDEPDPILKSLLENDRVLIRLPRSYPSQSLGWLLAHFLIRQQIANKVVLPFVISGTDLNPPRSGFRKLLPACMLDQDDSVFARVIIIEEPILNARNRTQFLTTEMAGISAKVIILTKSEDNVALTDTFITDNGFREFSLAPVSFSETAFFLEKAFAMTAREAEAVAIRLDDTFRKFRLDAHPTYFAGLQEETLAALINANKRAELIQLAVDGLLSLIVAADASVPPLSRTTRERFLKEIVIRMTAPGAVFNDATLLDAANKFLRDGLLPTPGPDFLRPFFEIGLLYRSNDLIFFTHPYLESYLIARSLKDDPEKARSYFDPNNEVFNYYAFDLYCELGPDHEIIANVLGHARSSVANACKIFPDRHVYLDTTRRLTSLTNRHQLVNLTQGLMASAEKLESDDKDDAVRADKQRILDAKRYVKTEVTTRDAEHKQAMPDDIREEFAILDALSRALSLCATAVGSGSESIGGDGKLLLAKQVLSLGSRFSDIWTRNRLRINFEEMRNEALSDENIWRMVEQLGAESAQFDAMKRDLQMFLHGFELNTILEPMGRVLWRISSVAGVKVLVPVLDKVQGDDEIEDIIRSAWMIDIDPERGRNSFKKSLANYSGAPLLRVVLASHLLWRAFWHHYKTAGSRYFVNSARRALRPLGLAPSPERIEEAKQGPS